MSGYEEFHLGDRTLVILGYKTGQLGNRLFHYSHWLANSWEYGYRLYNPSFDEYGKYFYKKNTIYAGGDVCSQQYNHTENYFVYSKSCF